MRSWVLTVAALSFGCSAIVGDYEVVEDDAGDGGRDLGRSDMGEPEDAGGDDGGTVDMFIEPDADLCGTAGACTPGEDLSCTTSCGTAGTGTCSDRCVPPTGDDCAPPEETCNGLDDDCDGVADNGLDYAARAVTLTVNASNSTDIRNARLLATTHGLVLVYAGFTDGGGAYVGAQRVDANGAPTGAVTQVARLFDDGDSDTDETIGAFDAVAVGDRVYVAWSERPTSLDGLRLQTLRILPAPSSAPLVDVREDIFVGPSDTRASDTRLAALGSSIIVLGRASSSWTVSLVEAGAGSDVSLTVQAGPTAAGVNPHPGFRPDGTPFLARGDGGDVVFADLSTASGEVVFTASGGTIADRSLSGLVPGPERTLISTGLNDPELFSLPASSLACAGCTGATIFSRRFGAALPAGSRWVLASRESNQVIVTFVSDVEPPGFLTEVNTPPYGSSLFGSVSIAPLAEGDFLLAQAESGAPDDVVGLRFVECTDP